MSNPWGRFFWNDWEQDPGLRLSSLAAQGLWMRMLCIAAKSDPIGYLTSAGRALTLDDLSCLTGRPGSELAPLIDELDRNGVFSRDTKGRIYSRRMLRDVRSSLTAKNNGKNGGNPSLSNGKKNIVPDKPCLKPQSYTPIPITTASLASAREIKFSEEEISKAKPGTEAWNPPVHDCEILPGGWSDFAEGLEVPVGDIYKSWGKFKATIGKPYALNRWQGWIRKESSAKQQLPEAAE